MTGPRIVVTGKSLDAVAAQVRIQHGPRARIVSAERVTSGGIAGLFARRYVEATVELPERGRRSARGSQDPRRAATAPPPSQRAFAPSPAQRVGLAALLADAEQAENALAQADAEVAVPEPAVSTRSGAFADLMDDLAFNGVVPESPVATPERIDAAASAAKTARADESAGTAPARPTDPAVAPAAAPVLLDGPGDLVLVLGRTADVVTVAQRMADAGRGPRAAVRVAGTAATGRFVAVSDRRAALEARAAGVELDRATLVAVGWDDASPEAVAAVGADQIWIAVDAGRKHADTERWIQAVTAVVAADGLAVVGLAETSTPETVRSLGLPVGWTDA